jgi:hypothetical protein
MQGLQKKKPGDILTTKIGQNDTTNQTAPAISPKFEGSHMVNLVPSLHKACHGDQEIFCLPRSDFGM